MGIVPDDKKQLIYYRLYNKKWKKQLSLFLLSVVSCFVGSLPLFAEKSVVSSRDVLYKSAELNFRFKAISNPQLDMVGGQWDTIQDKQGFLWFAGAGGLARFDGYSFKVYRHESGESNSLSTNYITRLLLDRSGDLWLATTEGLNRYDSEKDAFEHYKHDDSNASKNVMWDIKQAANGDIWVASQGGVDLFNPQTGEFYQLEARSDKLGKILNDIVFVVYEDQQGDFWLGTKNHGLIQYRMKQKKYVQYISGNSADKRLTDLSVSAINEDHDGNLWVGTYAGLNKINRQTNTVSHYLHVPDNPRSLGGDLVRRVVIDNRNLVWVASDGGGVSVYNDAGDNFSRFGVDEHNANGLINNKIRSIYKDNNGGLWFGHFPAGVSMLDQYATAFRNYRHNPHNSNSLSNSDILSLEEDQSGNLWVGTEKGLNLLNRENGQITRYIHDPDDPASLPANPVIAVYEDRFSQIWAGTWRGGLSLLDTDSGRFKHFPELNADEARVMEEDARGHLWIGVESGLSAYDFSSEKFIHYRYDMQADPSILQLGVNALYGGSKGKLWVGGNNSLNYFNQNKLSIDRFQYLGGDLEKVSESRINAIVESDDGELWVATMGGGVNRIDLSSGAVKVYRAQDGLADNIVAGIVRDDDGMMWFSTGRGLSRFDPSTGEFRNFTEEYGLPGNLFKSQSYLKTSNGELAFGSTKGLTIFNPANILENKHIPPVVVTSLEIFNKPVLFKSQDSPLQKPIVHTKELTFTHKQSVFSFEFAALNYNMPDKNRYAYRLDGFDSYWNYVGGRRTATYTNLDAGEYIFRVKASNNDGVWNEEGTKIILHILPPWWKTWWAYTLYLLSIVAIIFTYVRSVKIKMEQERAVIRRMQQLDKLKDEFLANTSHELRTPLHGIIGIAESLIGGVGGAVPPKVVNNLQMIVESGRRLNNLVNDILDFSKLKNRTLELNRKAVDLHALVDVVLALSKPMIGSKEIALNNDVPQNLSSIGADEDRLQQVLYNLVGNAIKFTDAGCVKVSAEQLTSKVVSISVSDTGIGIPEDRFENIFESFEQVDGAATRQSGGTGLGLAVTRKLVELHGGKLNVSSKVGEGSTFSFTLPISGAASDLVALAETPSITPEKAYDYSHEPVLKQDRLVTAPFAMASPYCSTDQSHLKILVVDDEPVNRQVLLNHLSLQNYSVVEAGSGAEALAAINGDQPFDLILLDVMMPRMSGFEVAQIIRQQYSTSELPIIFLTAKNQLTDLVIGFDAGANDFITKPIAKEELLARVQTHLQLLETNRNLEEKVQERTEQLNTEHQRLKKMQSQLVQSESIASVNTLVAGIAHEINNPTNYTHASLFNLESELKQFKVFLFDLASSDEVEVLEVFADKFSSFASHLSTMREGTMRIQTLVEDLHTFSNPDQAELKEFNLKTGLQMCLDVVRANYVNKVDFEFAVEDEVNLFCNPAQLNQVFMSIILNACQSIEEKQDGEENPALGHLKVTLAEDAGTVVIRFVDTGCGMSEETKNHLFDPFYTTRAVGLGTGLGLSIAYSIIEKHRGRIEVESQCGVGSTITIYLPDDHKL